MTKTTQQCNRYWAGCGKWPIWPSLQPVFLHCLSVTMPNQRAAVKFQLVGWWENGQYAAGCGCSSVGRARASQARGRGFEPRCPLQFSSRSSFYKGILCEAAQLGVIRLPHVKFRCQIKRNDMSDAVNAQKAPMPVEVEEGKHYFWCACGKSAKQPFCDGSHKDTGVSPVKYTAEASKRVFFCGCKQSAKAPLCDGTHSKL